MAVVVLAKAGTDLGRFEGEPADGVAVVRWSNLAADIAELLKGAGDRIVVVSDGCTADERAALAVAVGAVQARVIEVQGAADQPHGNELSAACTGVISGFGIEAGVAAAVGVLNR